MRLGLADGRIARVDIGSTRAPLPASLTHGRPIEEVAAIMPRLFAICGQAQGAAAACALQAAAGLAPSVDGLRERADAVDREAIVELLTRLLLDWPRALGDTPSLAPLALARQALVGGTRRVLAEIAREHVFDATAASFLAQSPLDDWMQAGVTLPARLLARLQRQAADLSAGAVSPLPDLSAAALAQQLPPLTGDDVFSRLPQWNGCPALTGPLARHAEEPLLHAYLGTHGTTVAAHLLAQLIDLALRLNHDVAASGTLQSATLADGSGLGMAATARGLLLHQAHVAAGRVVHYRIVAPTEWNFHPDGALPRGLRGRAVVDAAAARRDAQLLAQALDPCVACTVEVVDA